LFQQILNLPNLQLLHKGGSKEDPSNYRPISLLPAFSKILEKVVYLQLSAFLGDTAILTDNQYGFQKRRSNVCCKKQARVNIFLDLQKTFDTVDHNPLLQKLKVYGCSGKCLEWFASYLQDRQQYVSFGSTSSLSATCNL
jgi:hypothetical protein